MVLSPMDYILTGIGHWMYLDRTNDHDRGYQALNVFPPPDMKVKYREREKGEKEIKERVMMVLSPVDHIFYDGRSRGSWLF